MALWVVVDSMLLVDDDGELCIIWIQKLISWVRFFDFQRESIGCPGCTCHCESLLLPLEACSSSSRVISSEFFCLVDLRTLLCLSFPWGMMLVLDNVSTD
jgi:hypothetical protein